MKTLKEWSADGFKVIKGSKSTQRNKQGIALFSQEQVERPDWLKPPYANSQSFGTKDTCEPYYGSTFLEPADYSDFDDYETELSYDNGFKR